VLVPGGFNTTTDPGGNHYLYPQGDLNVPPSGRMPKNGYYFDAVIRQPEIDEDNLNPEDNLEEFKPVTPEELEYFKKAAQALSSRQGRDGEPGGTALATSRWYRPA
jgi:hypothetical protein